MSDDVKTDEKPARATHALIFELEYVAAKKRQVEFTSIKSAVKTKGVELTHVSFLRSGMSPLSRAAVTSVLKQAGKIRSIGKYVKELESVLSVVDDYNLDCDVNVDLAELRGFNYYTGVTFEILSRDIPTPLIRGGRYDELMGKYGYDAPATGVAIDLESLLDYSKKHLEGNQIHFVVIPKKSTLRREAIHLAEWLRSSGFKVILDLNLNPEQRAQRIKENQTSNFYGVILLETPKKLKLIESKKGASKEFSNLEELLKGGI